MRHTIVIEVPDTLRGVTAEQLQETLTGVIERVLSINGRYLTEVDRPRVAQYHMTDLTPTCVECGAPMDKCPGGRGHVPEGSQEGDGCCVHCPIHGGY